MVFMGFKLFVVGGEGQGRVGSSQRSEELSTLTTPYYRHLLEVELQALC
jgi:hypothetical protein